MSNEFVVKNSLFKNPEIRYLLTILSFICAITIFRVFLQFSFSLTIVWKLNITLNFAVLLVYYVGRMFRPTIAFSIVSIGFLFGDGLYCLVYGCGGELPIYLAISIFSYGGMVLLISILRKKNIFLSYFVGSIWFYIGFMIPSYIYYLVFYDAYEIMVFAGSLIITLLNIIFIPLAIFLIYLTKKLFQIDCLEQLLFFKSSEPSVKNSTD